MSIVSKKKLSDTHRAELHASGLTDETIEAAGFYSARNGEIKRILGWRPKGHDWGEGWVCPFDHNANGDGYAQVKLDFPRHRDEDPIKYEMPRGRSNRAYLPPGVTGAMETSNTVVITEGTKKALAVWQAGVPCIGLTGVWNWQQARPRDDLGRKYGPRKLISDLAGINWHNKKIVIIFDSDTATNVSVQLAQARLAETLVKAGASVNVATIPASGESKLGIDDYMLSHGTSVPARLQELIQSSTQAELPDKWGPMEWAKAIVQEEFGGDRTPTVRWWRDEFWRWTRTRWVRVPTGEFKALILAWLDGRKPGVTPRYANDVAKCIGSVVHTRFDLDMPAFIGGKDTPDPTSIIGCHNGLLDISNMGGDLIIIKHTPWWFSPTVLDYSFDPDARCPRWEKFLCVSLSDDPERIKLLQKWFGLLLTSNTSYQKFLMMVGPPRSGKGTITRVLQTVVGPDNCASPMLSALGGEFGLWPLVDKTVAILPDAHISQKADSVRVLEVIKSVVGEDALDINRKNLRQLLNVRLTTRFVVTVNELPHFNDTSGALVSRLSILPFSESFVGKEDRNLERTLMNEAPGILNWALRGLNMLRRDEGFHIPKASESILSSFTRLSSPIAAFIDDYCLVGPGNEVPCGDLYEVWQHWAKKNGHNEMAAAKFGERLRAAHPEIDRYRHRTEGGTRAYSYTNIGLNSSGRGTLHGVSSCP